MNIPANKYVAKAVHAELGHAKTGTEMIAVLFEITEGEYTGQRITWWGYFTEKTARRAVESLKYTGWRGDWESWDGLGTKRVELDVQEEADGQGGSRLRVQWVNPVSIIKKDSVMSSTQRVAFASKMRGLVTQVLTGAEGAAPAAPRAVPPRSAQPQQPRPRVQQQPPAQVWGADDEVPF